MGGLYALAQGPGLCLRLKGWCFLFNLGFFAFLKEPFGELLLVFARLLVAAYPTG